MSDNETKISKLNTKIGILKEQIKRLHSEDAISQSLEGLENKYIVETMTPDEKMEYFRTYQPNDDAIINFDKDGFIQQQQKEFKKLKEKLKEKETELENLKELNLDSNGGRKRRKTKKRKSKKRKSKRRKTKRRTNKKK